jgi:hypothetical protein
MKNKKYIILEHLTFLKDESSLAPRLDNRIQRRCNKINEICAEILGQENIVNYNWIETGLLETPKYIKYNGTGDWYIKSDGYWTFIPNNLDSFINNITIN